MASPNRTLSAIRIAGVAAGACALAAWSVTCTEYDSSLLAYSHADASPQDVQAQDESAPDSTESGLSDAAEEPAVDAATEAQADADAATGPCDPACTDPDLIRPPCPPNVPDPTSLPDSLVFAMHTVRGGMTKAAMDDWKTIGLDLDCLFTKKTGSPTMCKSTASDLSVIEDGEQGRDNSFGKNLGGAIRLMELFGIIDTDVEVAWNQGLADGSNGLLFKIDDYGGGADDPQVTISVYPSTGVYDEAGVTELTANWDGNDFWTVDRNSTTPLGTAKYLDDAAFVAGYKVVGHLPEGLPLKFNASGGVLELALTRSTFVLEMSPDRQHVVSAVLGGVWYTSSAISALDDYASQTGVCPDQPQYAAARNILANSSDIRVDLKPAPNLDCNGMSIGLAFTADPAKIGAVLDAPPTQPSQCGDAGTDAN